MKQFKALWNDFEEKKNGLLSDPDIRKAFHDKAR
jgi:hypothetical protein